VRYPAASATSRFGGQKLWIRTWSFVMPEPVTASTMVVAKAAVPS
jgi:hypothetical protein